MVVAPAWRETALSIYWALRTTAHPTRVFKEMGKCQYPPRQTPPYTHPHTHTHPCVSLLEQFLLGEEAAVLTFELMCFWPCLEILSSLEGAKIPPRGVEIPHTIPSSAQKLNWGWVRSWATSFASSKCVLVDRWAMKPRMMRQKPKCQAGGPECLLAP